MRKILLLLLLASALAGAEPLFHDGDRIVFFGDSITEFGNYTNAVESYITLRYPQMKLEFFNAGWAGDNTEGGLYRLERDVLALKPTLVTICFGMNDAYYMKREDWVGKLFYDHLKELVTKIRASGARVVLLTVGIVDEEGEKNDWMKDVNYNAGGLEMIRQKGLELAKKEGLPIFDLHTLMTEVTARARKEQKGFVLHSDGIHPDEGGGLVMAYALLKALGVPERHESVSVDVESGKILASAGLSAGRFTKNPDGSLSFNLGMAGLPFYVAEKGRKILPYLPWQQDFNHFEIKVSGLKGKASLELGPEPGDYLEPSEFEKGMSLEELWDSEPLSQAREVEEFCAEKTKAYQQLWRNLALKPNFNQWEAYRPLPHKLGISDNVKLQELQREMAQPVSGGVEVKIWPWPREGELLNNDEWIRTLSLSPAIPKPESGTAMATVDVSATQASALTSTAGFWSVRRLNVQKPGNNLGFLLDSKADAFAAVRIDSSLAQEVQLKVGADDEFEAWMNGRPVGKTKKGGALKVDGDILKVSLKTGSNLLLIRVINHGKAAGLVARFSGLEAPLRYWPASLDLIKEVK